MTALGIALALGSALVFGVAAVLQAHTVRRFERVPDALGHFLARSVSDGRTWMVVAAYLVGFVLHAGAIWLLPLYLAQATIAMSLPVTALASRRVEDALTGRHWAAVGVLTAGLAFLTLGAGDPGEGVTSVWFGLAVWTGVLVLAGASIRGRHYNGALLGGLAGLGYAGSAVSVRGISTPVDSVVVACALAVPAYSTVAFWLYSLGMRRAAVASASGALIVAQTFVPAAVGVSLLGDGVRPGWWPAVVGGLLLATAGAVVLSSARRPPESVPLEVALER